MKVFRGAEVLSTAYNEFARSGFRPSFFNFRESKKIIREFFNEYSFIELIMSIFYSIPRAGIRFIIFLKRIAVGKRQNSTDESSVFLEGNFMDSKRQFRC